MRLLAAFCLFALVGLWIAPFARAIKANRDANEYYAESGGGDALDDIMFSKVILSVYTFCALSGVVNGLMTLGTRRLWWLLPLACSLASASYVMLARPFYSVGLFPDGRPFERIAGLCAIGDGLALWFVAIAYLSKRVRSPNSTVVLP